MRRRIGFRRTAAVGTVVAFGVLAVPTAGLSLVFSTPLTYSVGANPKAVVTADFNGDGKADLATANAGSGDVSILLGNGDGTFQAAPTLPTGLPPGPSSIAVADLNNDLVPDLVVPNQTAGSAVVLLGNGDGTFHPGAAFPAVSNPTSVAVGDFNKDGFTDIATSSSSGQIGLLRGNGDGTFLPPASVPALGSVGMLAVGDLNGDGFLDLVATEPSRATGVVIFANGPSGFQAPNRFPTGLPTAVTVADLNGDGISDAAFVSSDPLLTILLGRTVGAPALLVTNEEALQSVTTGDFDGDGNVDLVFAQSPDAVLFKPGHGDGTFGGGFKKFAASKPVAVAGGDFNGDGKLDMAAAGDGTNVVSILLNDAVATQQVLPPGGTVSTGADATLDTPVQVDATAPATGSGGSITITSSNASNGSGFGIAGQQVNIKTFTSTASDPFQFTFRIDASLIPRGQSAATLDVYKDGNLVADCSGPGAVPDPCVATRTQLASGDAEITVLTSSASAWTFSFPVYAFNGFFQPVDNPPVLNEVQAGRGVPVKFSLGGFQGNAVFAAGYPKAQQVSCNSAPVDAIEQTVTAGSSSLSYDSTTDTYTYVWKTDRSWSGTCRQLVARLADGSYRRAMFKFK